ncbi:acyltransferase family protein [Microbacterium murale]|nr:acyltransferase family protein [Microbacterium murale]
MHLETRDAPLRSRVKRLVVPDVLRGVAIVAMLIAHAVPMIPDVPRALAFVMGNINALASPLFALVMGMAAQIVWNRKGGVGRTILQQSLRGVALIALGVWMMTWGSWVAVVLQYLGLLLLVGAPLLLLGTRALIIVTAVIAVASQPVLEWARGAAWIYSQPTPVIEVANWVALGPSYRLVNLLPFFLLGAILLRHGIRCDRVLWTMAIVAPIAYLASMVGGRFLVADVKSGDYLDTLRDVGLVFATYVVVVLIAEMRLKGAARIRDAVFAPLSAWGQVALSLYLLHVGIIAWWAHALNGRPEQNSPLGWLSVVVLPLIVGWLWWRFVGPGPVEWVLGWVTGRPKRRRSR